MGHVVQSALSRKVLYKLQSIYVVVALNAYIKINLMFVKIKILGD